MRIIRFAALLPIFLVCAMAVAQTFPTTRGAGRGRGRGFGRGPTTTPGEILDANGLWYTPQKHAEYAFGYDASSQLSLEQQGQVFKEEGKPKPLLQILRDHGYNWIRLRVCKEPARLPQNTDYVIAAAKEAKALGFKYLLDFHYSNSWADPTNEPTPTDWQGLSHPQLVTALFEYTRDTVAKLAAANVLPDAIQVGNEIGNGFLWPAARLPEHWDDFADLVHAGVSGIDAGRGNGARPIILIHVDHGGNADKTKVFFDKLNSYGVAYDAIGFSFYPWSHGTLLDLRENLAFAANAYGKNVYVVETGYYHQPSQYFRVLPGPFAETPAGQAQWLAAVNNEVMQVPGGRGKGVFWWGEPSGGLNGRSYFDADGNVQAIINVFDQFTRPLHRTDGQ